MKRKNLSLWIKRKTFRNKIKFDQVNDFVTIKNLIKHCSLHMQGIILKNFIKLINFSVKVEGYDKLVRKDGIQIVLSTTLNLREISKFLGYHLSTVD